MGTDYTPLFLFVLVAIATAGGMLGVSAILSPGARATRGNRVKQMPYESGMDPIGDARQRFDVRYYLVAIEFLIFDVEILLLYPWAVAQWSATAPAGDPQSGTAVALAAAAGIGVPPEFRNLVFAGVMIFVAVLAAGFAYTWKKGVYEWR